MVTVEIPINPIVIPSNICEKKFPVTKSDSFLEAIKTSP